MGTSSGPGSRYLDPHRVYELVIRRMPRQLLDYLDSIPGASQDLHCYRLKLVGGALLSQPPRSLPEEKWMMILGRRAWGHAIYSRLCAPPMVDNPTNFTSDAGHGVHPDNSSSFSGRVLTNEPGSNELRHAAMHNQLSASRSRNHATTFPPLKEKSSDVMLDETSASNSGTHASAYAASRAQALKEIMQNIVSPHELEQNNHGTLELGTFWLRQPGSENRKGLPTVDIKGKRPAASEVDQIKVKILRLNVACFVVDGLNSAAGVLVRNGSTAQFISASCFSPMLRTEPALLFAAACCKAIKIALSYEPTTIVLESHLFALLSPLYVALNHQQPDIVQLTDFLSQGHPHFIVQKISEGSNGAACQLALNVLHVKESYMFFNDLPEWLVPYLDE